MNVLVIGGTGLISTGIVKHLLARGATVTMYNRKQRENTLPASVQQLSGDRNDFAEFEASFAKARYDAVIDMICFSPDQAKSAVRAFGGRCEQLLFCSTVCSYGVKVPPHVLIDETFPQEPLSDYGKNKLTCERIFLAAAAEKKFACTIVRPSHTYGPGGSLIDQLEFDSGTWDRVVRGLPILCAGDGLGLWQSTHRDDCGMVFAQATLLPKAYGEAYNATRDEVFTWRDYYREAARALDTTAQLLFVPTAWLLQRLPERMSFLREITQFHGAYSSAKAKAHLPSFHANIGFEQGARETLTDVRRRGAWRDSRSDTAYQKVVDEALGLGLRPEPA
ncbi:MAG TPA: NAD-dependent epimerase/dehydratase family protein [Polyangiaceae bacterium]|jgi:nucleoside-diphosphate-sugar epimerase